MSTLTVSNVSDGTTSVPTTYVTNGSAKAWVNFDGTGTIALQDSLNVSSLTDNGVGNYTVNTTSAFSSADFAAAGGSQANYNHAVYPITASGVTVLVANNAFTNVDDDNISVTAHGDLA